MKKKVMSVFFQLAWAALLVISLLYPRTRSITTVSTAIVGMVCICIWSYRESNKFCWQVSYMAGPIDVCKPYTGCHRADRRWCYLYLAELGHSWAKVQGHVGCRM